MLRINWNKSLLAERSLFWTITTLLALTPSLAHSQVRLLPAPRESHFSGETPLPERLSVEVIGHDAEDEFAAHDLEEAAHQPSVREQTGPIGYRVTLMRTSSPESKA